MYAIHSSDCMVIRHHMSYSDLVSAKKKGLCDDNDMGDKQTQLLKLGDARRGESRDVD